MANHPYDPIKKKNKSRPAFLAIPGVSGKVIAGLKRISAQTQSHFHFVFRLLQTETAQPVALQGPRYTRLYRGPRKFHCPIYEFITENGDFMAIMLIAVSNYTLN